MRQKIDSQLYISWSGEASLKVQREYREKYEKIDDLVNANRRIIDLIHEDVKKLSSGGKGRRSKYTSENILRSLIVHQVEGTNYRETAVRIAESEFLQEFVQLGNRPPMDFSFLCRCFKAITPETWERVNKCLIDYGVEQKKVDTSVIRADTTVVESNIHYPTDSSLLWDAWRVLVRLIREGKKRLPFRFDSRFHDRKVKKLYLFIARYIKSRSKSRKQIVRTKFKELIAQVRRVISDAEQMIPMLEGCLDLAAQGIAESMKGYLPAASNVVSVTERVQLLGEKVPGGEKTYSIFEQHVELLKRGKRQKPVEFGHKILLTQTREKLITGYEVMEKQRPDSELARKLTEEHKKLFGEYPEVLAADKGFREEAKKMEELEGKVKWVAIPKQPTDWGKEKLQPWQAFRAGVEGSISVLKRAFRLIRCCYRGFKSFAASVGMAVFCHNLVQLTGVNEPQKE